MFSIDGAFVASAYFVEETLRATPTGGAGCVVPTAKGSRQREVGAGDMRIVVPTRDGDRTVELPFDPAKGSYELATTDTASGFRFDEPGATLRIHADGDRAPAFDAEIRSAGATTFDLPEVVELDAATPRDVVLGWSPSDNDEVFVDLTIGSDASIMCIFPASSAGGTIPASNVAELVGGTKGECGPGDCQLFVAAVRRRQVTSGAYLLALSHGFAAVKPVKVLR